MNEPIIGAKISPGMLVSVTISPAFVAEPVRLIAIQGMSINTIEPANRLMKLAVSSRMNGFRLRATPGVTPPTFEPLDLSLVNCLAQT
jgi:hypothetical protein